MVEKHQVPSDLETKYVEIDNSVVPKSREIYRGDINDAVIKVQKITGFEITPEWWAANVGNDGSTEDILDRFDSAFELFVQEKIKPAETDKNLDENLENEIIRERAEELAKFNEVYGDDPGAAPLREEFLSDLEENLMNKYFPEVGLEATQGLTNEEVAVNRAWESYRPLGSESYEQANQERVRDGKIKVSKIEKGKDTITLVANIKIDPETGQVVSGHEGRPEAESMSDTEGAFSQYLLETKPDDRLVIYEGDKRHFETRDESIEQGSDSGLIQFLAESDDVETRAGELTESEFVVEMEKRGATRAEILALRVAQGLAAQVEKNGTDFLAGYINFQAANIGMAGFDLYSEEEKIEIEHNGTFDEFMQYLDKKVIDELLPDLNQQYREIVGGEDLFVVVDGAVSINSDLISDISGIATDKLGWSGDSRINEVNRMSMEVRDRHIFEQIIKATNEGKSPLVVYGGSHIVTISPALEAHQSEAST